MCMGREADHGGHGPIDLTEYESTDSLDQVTVLSIQNTEFQNKKKERVTVKPCLRGQVGTAGGSGGDRVRRVVEGIQVSPGDTECWAKRSVSP